MKKILFVSSQIFITKKKANFHHLAIASSKNAEVWFCTIPNGLNTLLLERKQRKLRYKTFFYAFSPKKHENVNVTSYVSLAAPQNRDIALNKVLKLLFPVGYSSVLKKKYDIVIFDNGVPLFLFEKLKRKNPQSKFIYRVSDPARDNVSWSEIEKKAIHQFSLISTPSLSITNTLKEKYNLTNIKTHYHGINKELFQKECNNPYKQYSNGKKHFIFVGVSKFDSEFLSIASDISPDYIFHIIGPIDQKVKRDNIVYYGEMGFEKTIPFIKYADVGLQTLEKFPNCTLYEKTLKFTQYTFFKKPILSPVCMELKDANNFSYENTTVSIQKAINMALKFDTSKIDRSWIKSWDEIAMELCE